MISEQELTGHLSQLGCLSTRQLSLHFGCDSKTIIAAISTFRNVLCVSFARRGQSLVPIFSMDGLHIGGFCVCGAKLTNVPQEYIDAQTRVTLHNVNEHCVKCHRKKARRIKKGLRKKISRKKELPNVEFSHASPYVPSWGDFSDEYEVPPEDNVATVAYPGTEEKIDVLSWRYDNGIPLWNDDDQSDWSNFEHIIKR